MDEIATEISWADLEPGDMDPAQRHVKLFEEWADSAKTSAWIHEEGSG
ncbi:hypothetical protein [Lentzea xinjiangensis]|nr:hypothetical protein [Lentzea xinjiangensis]